MLNIQSCKQVKQEDSVVFLAARNKTIAETTLEDTQ